MSSLNRVDLIGNLGADPETRYAQSGDAITNIRLAMTEKWRDKQTGEPKEQTEWMTVVFFGKMAEVAGEYLKKGSKVFVSGKFRTREYEKEGVKRYVTEVRAENMVLLDRKEGAPAAPSQRPARQSSANDYAKASGRAAPPAGDFDDDIPF